MGVSEKSVGAVCGGGATSCMSYGISGGTVCIIPTKVCTCLARSRNASGETTKDPKVFPGGENLGSLNRRQ